jgi:hypothetical protein
MIGFATVFDDGFNIGMADDDLIRDNHNTARRVAHTQGRLEQ